MPVMLVVAIVAVSVALVSLGVLSIAAALGAVTETATPGRDNAAEPRPAAGSLFGA